MQGFQYKHGDRPLEGYTIQRAIGRGGFGEVYYALSDTGREVALKAIQGYEHIELRGVRQCMNLKSPHLVTIFDVRYNDQGRAFVLMEYVAGPSLRDLLDESPAGLGQAKAAFFLREAAKGLGFLHECGIVHRDLKPGNIFYENGYVKVGDYGLSKAILPTARASQTVTVGTVHYMAPEIGAGNYNRSIDIYALGVVLYEMLTGCVPYGGDSPGEILMKHMTSQPDLKGIAEPFATAVRRAMSKDPAQRYQSVREMIEEVFGAEHVREGVSQFSPNSLSMVAERAAREVAGAGVGVAGVPPAPVPRADRADRTPAAPTPADGAGGTPAVPKKPQPPGSIVIRDPIDARQRRTLAVIAAVAVATGTALIGQAWSPRQWTAGYDWAWLAAAPLLMIFAASAGILHARRRWRLNLAPGTFGRLGFGGLGSALVVLVALALGIIFGVRSPLRGSVLAICLSLFLMDWHRMTSPTRSERVSLGRAVAAAACAAILAGIFGGNYALAGGVLAGVCLAVQAASPFDPTARRQAKALGLSPADAIPYIVEDAPGTAGVPLASVPGTHSAGETPATPKAPAAPSEHSRLVALLMTAGGLFGVNGLQRFYVGKTGTGVLWLLTVGLLGVGQLVDLIMLVMGSFADKAGRRVQFWFGPGAPGVGAAAGTPGPARPADALSRLSSVTQRAGALIFAGLAAVAIAVAIMVGLMLVTDLPGAAEAGLLGRDFARFLEREVFGYAAWPVLLRRIGWLIVGSTLVLAAIALILARRRAGFGHIFRGLLATAGLLAVLRAAAAAMGQIPWMRVVVEVNRRSLGPALEAFGSSANQGQLILAAALLLASVLALAWPPPDPDRAAKVARARGT